MANYPISNVARRVVFSGSAGVGPYAFTFEVLNETDIAVYKNTTLLVLTTDYTVTVNANGTGEVTLVSAATSSDTITIVGARAVQRTTDFVTGGDLFANTLNDEMDSQTIFVQQVAEEVQRSIKAPVTDPTTINMTLPAKASRAGKVLSFNSTTGDPETTVSATQVSTVAGIANDITTVAGIAGNVTTVAGISSSVTTTANTVAPNIANVNTVAGNITAVQIIGADLAGTGFDYDLGSITDAATGGGAAPDGYIPTVYDNLADITTVAGIAADVTTVAGVSVDVSAIADIIPGSGTGFLTKTGPTTWAFDGATYQPLDGDLTAIAGLSGTSGFLKKTGSNTWTLDTSTYLTGNQSISLSGDASGSGATSISITLASTGVTPGSYTNADLTVDAKGRITAVSNGAGAGGVTDGDKGDITVSSTGTVWTIDSQAVTYAKIQNVSATDKLLGRSTAGAGTIEEITCTSAGRALLDDADATAQRTTLGLGSLATKSSVGSSDLAASLDLGSIV